MKLLKLSYDRPSASQSVLVSGHHLAPVINFSLVEIFFVAVADLLLWGANSCEKMGLLGLSSAAHLGSIFLGTHDQILLSKI
jgi:hypothetical protein